MRNGFMCPSPPHSLYITVTAAGAFLMVRDELRRPQVVCRITLTEVRETKLALTSNSADWRKVL